MKLLLVTLLSLVIEAKASLPELFGPSAASMAIGSQALKESAANNYHAAALLGYSKTTLFSFDVFYIDTQFSDIQNVTIRNDTNTVNSLETGDLKVNSSPITMLGAHVSTPLFSQEGPKLNFSLFTPFDRLLEASSGDPYLPRYVMYQDRMLRPILVASLAQSFNDWSFSAGLHTGLQANGESYFITRMSGGEASLGKISFNAKPSIAATASIAKKYEEHVSYLSFKQEMKSQFQNRATGETDVAGGGFGQFDLTLSSLLYYDPMTLKLGHQIHSDETSIYFSIEFQQWDHYESSILKLKKNSGTINGSENFENLKLKNIVIPRIGIERDLSLKWKGKVGYFFRQSPIDVENLKNSGNTIDVDKHVASMGLARDFSIYEKNITLDMVYQGHFLQSRKIIKTPNREDGDPSQPKIGSPGYRVGGMIHALSFGLNWKY
jgi:long-subunit fatty acid transport protein